MFVSITIKIYFEWVGWWLRRAYFMWTFCFIRDRTSSTYISRITLLPYSPLSLSVISLRARRIMPLHNFLFIVALILSHAPPLVVKLVLLFIHSKSLSHTMYFSSYVFWLHCVLLMLGFPSLFSPSFISSLSAC